MSTSGASPPIIDDVIVPIVLYTKFWKRPWPRQKPGKIR
jgi:hypothetical protein